MIKNYVAYYRVSTQEQGKSGLGLDSQKTMVKNFIQSREGRLIEEFIEIETGTKKRKRIEIFNAIHHAKINGAVLIIAKLDRLARNVHFVSSLMETGVEFVAVDMPEANNFTIHLFSAIAEMEAKLISERTKSALAELKNRGVKLGNSNLTYDHRVKGALTNKENSRNDPNNVQTNALIIEYRLKGYSYRKISEILNQLNFKTSAKMNHTSTSVYRIHLRNLAL